MFRPGPGTGRADTHCTALLRRTATMTGLLAGIVATFLSPSPASAQSTGRVTGVVTDSASSRPVGDVQVLVVGTRIGGVTDAQGRYTIVGAPAGTRTIEARRIGYKASRIPNVNVAIR